MNINTFRKAAEFSGTRFNPQESLSRLTGDDRSGGTSAFSPIKNAFHEVNDLQLKADRSAEDFSVTDSDSIHKVVVDMEEAFLSLRFAMNVRNKAVEAYQEVMRMQI